MGLKLYLVPDVAKPNKKHRDRIASVLLERYPRNTIHHLSTTIFIRPLVVIIINPTERCLFKINTFKDNPRAV